MSCSHHVKICLSFVNNPRIWINICYLSQKNFEKFEFRFTIKHLDDPLILLSNFLRCSKFEKFLSLPRRVEKKVNELVQSILIFFSAQISLSDFMTNFFSHFSLFLSAAFVFCDLKKKCKLNTNCSKCFPLYIAAHQRSLTKWRKCWTTKFRALFASAFIKGSTGSWMIPQEREKYVYKTQKNLFGHHSVDPKTLSNSHHFRSFINNNF